MMQTWYNNLIANIKAGDTKTFNEALWEPSSWPKQARGVGFMEAPRGATGALDRHRGRNHQELPGRGAEYLECGTT